MPPTRKQPQDRLAKAEATGAPIEFEFDGEHYAIDRDNADNLELLEFIEEDKYLLAIRGYLGPDQWKQWKDTHRDDKGRVHADLFEPFLNVVMDAIGGSKNSSASSGS